MDTLFTILLIVQVIICLCMGALILVQKSEGGALGMGGGPSGFMSARGAGNLLTTLTGWFAFAFFACSIALTVVGNIEHRTTSALEHIDTSKLTVQTPATPAAPAAAASASSSSASGPSLNDLPVLGTAPAPQAPQPAQQAQRVPAAPLNTAPIKLPSVSSSSASMSQKDINKAKSSIWDKPAQSNAPASSASSAKSSVSVAPPPPMPIPSAPAPAAPASH
ncbi:MAG TPA: preprotein translocase subunit SecG [Asticcacaulis sp.]|nr:preprotein translocase subunit SecG [Asticcacaulis sp.]